MVVKTTWAWVRCIVINTRLIAKKPINRAYPTEVKSLGDHLRKTRLDRNLSQPNIAKQFQVSTDTVTGWEMNKYIPTPKYAKLIIDFLGYFPFNDNNLTHGKELYFARLRAGLTQEEVAKIIGCDENTIRLFELDKRKVSMNTLAKIDTFINQQRKIYSHIDL